MPAVPAADGPAPEERRDVWTVFERSATTLERSADLADLHAERHERAGHSELCAHERKVAARARAEAELARTRAREVEELARKSRYQP